MKSFFLFFQNSVSFSFFKSKYCSNSVFLSSSWAFYLAFCKSFYSFSLLSYVRCNSHQLLHFCYFEVSGFLLGLKASLVLNFQCMLATKGVWHHGCSEQRDVGDLSDLQCWFDVEQRSSSCKCAVATAKQPPITNLDFGCPPTARKVLHNHISSFWSSSMEEKLIIAVSGFLEMYDASLIIYHDIQNKIK